MDVLSIRMPILMPRFVHQFFRGQNWIDIESTWLNFTNVTEILELPTISLGFTFVIPRSDQRPRKGIALSQLMTGSIRIIVSLMVLAAKFDISVNTLNQLRHYFYINMNRVAFEEPPIDYPVLWNPKTGR
ncbi:hypothetical protein IGI04_007498 [Brassica rapa subsp. trilocularis]|uniref:Aminotransferase-like plant mobile domain-containing protein n=1 Tax=Brassica rapa subsp. trilocularis TaxID=1813537 RepID=A0ABQ7NN54_BRACM|nr:hypothetical protein IGI04_007498 [Brassica rapa subsp. trilocularis]